MNQSPVGTARVLAIDPTSKGIGFAVLEGPDRLVAWGVKYASENRECRKQAAALIVRFQPDVLVVERTDVRGCRRWRRALRLIESLAALAGRRRLRARRVSRRAMLRFFAQSGSAGKHQIAVALSLQFPELSPYLPPERKFDEGENARMSIFDALAFAITYYESQRRERRPLSLLPPENSLRHA